MIEYISIMAIPLMLFVIVITGIIEKKDALSLFVQGWCWLLRNLAVSHWRTLISYNGDSTSFESRCIGFGFFP